jgi:hypothetical protein
VPEPHRRGFRQCLLDGQPEWHRDEAREIARARSRASRCARPRRRAACSRSRPRWRRLHRAVTLTAAGTGSIAR